LKQRAIALIADYVGRRGLGRVVDLKPVGRDDYVLAIEDLRDERVHVGRTPRDFEPWLRSVKEGRYVIPAFGLCGRCGEIHSDRDWDLEMFRTCISCQAELVELALELYCEQEAEG
jgi:hypothetical protein